MKSQRLAAIDIGTNSIRCIIVEPDNKGGFKILDDEKSTVRLGENLARTGNISNQAIERSLEAVGRFKRTLEGMNVSAVEAIATSAMRRANNGEQLLRDLSIKLEHPIRVISGVEEAELAMISAQRQFDMEYKRYTVFDIGGGSLEIAVTLGNHIEECYSLDLGAVVMTEQFIKHDPPLLGELKKLQRHVRETMKKELQTTFPILSMIGSGGTVTAIASMIMNMRDSKYPSVHGYELLRSEVVHLYTMLGRKNLRERRLVQGLNADRADIIIAGIAVVDQLMSSTGANEIIVNERGIREGLIVRGMEKHGLMQHGKKTISWRDRILDFAHSCRFDEVHAKQVAQLSLLLFDAVAQNFGILSADRKLLEAAALLHDVGYFIAYSSHHKHSYHLIRHAELYGFNPLEREIIAQVARYHRKALPKKKHETYSALSEKDRQRVMKLAGILRLSDGLDRRRSSAVSSLSCTLTHSCCKIILQSNCDISVEIFGAASKKDLFEKAFCLEVLILEDSQSKSEK